MLDNLAKRGERLPAEPLRGVPYLCTVLHALARVEEPSEPVRREPECLCHELHKLAARTLDGRHVSHERGLESRKVLLLQPLLTFGAGRRSKSDISPCIKKPQPKKTARRAAAGHNNKTMKVRWTPEMQVLGLAGGPATFQILERRRKVEQLALIRDALDALNAEAGLAEEVGRFGHA